MSAAAKGCPTRRSARQWRQPSSRRQARRAAPEEGCPKPPSAIHPLDRQQTAPRRALGPSPAPLTMRVAPLPSLLSIYRSNPHCSRALPYPPASLPFHLAAASSAVAPLPCHLSFALPVPASLRPPLRPRERSQVQT